MTENELARTLWRGRYLIGVSLVLTVVAALVITARLPRVYQASGIVQVQSTGTTQATPGELPGLQEVSQGLAASYATLLDSTSFLQRLRDKTSEHLTLGELQTRVSASAMTVNNAPTNLIKIVATGSSPEDAVRLAGDVSTAFVTLIRTESATQAKDQQSQLNAQIEDLTTRIAALRGEPGATAAERVRSLSAARTALSTQLAAIVASQISAGQSVTAVAPPAADDSPVSPHPMLNLVVGVLVGLLIGLGLAWAREKLDTGLESAKQAETLLGVPNLAVIPLVSGHDGQAAHDFVENEAFELLRTNLSFMAVEHHLKVLTIASYNAGEGKSSVAQGLATAAARSGLRVLVVDGDLRTGELSRRLGAVPLRLPGFANLILNASQPSKSAGKLEQPVDVPLEPRDILKYVRRLEESAWLLPAGVVPPNPASLLSASAVKRLFDSLRSGYDLVIVDTPPVAHLADASLLSAHADGVVLVARVGLTKRTDLQGAADSLRHLPTPLLGSVVLDDRPPLAEQYYGSHTVRDAVGVRLHLGARLLGRVGRSTSRPSPAPSPADEGQQQRERGGSPKPTKAQRQTRDGPAQSGGSAQNGAASAERKPAAS